MSRLILTFETLFQVLSADKALKSHFKCRPVPTPPGLSNDICGISLELLDTSERFEALNRLQENQLAPQAIHELV